MPIAGGAGIGNNTNLTDIQREKYEQYIRSNLSNSQIQNAYRKLVVKGIQSAIVDNENEIKALLRQENVLSLGTPIEQLEILTRGLSGEALASVSAQLASCQANITIRNVKQKNLGSVEAAASSRSTVITNLSNAMKVGIQEQVNNLQQKINEKNQGSTLQGILGTVGDTFSNLGDNLEAVFDGSMGGAGIGNNYNQTKVSEKSNSITQDHNMESALEVNENQMQDMSLANELSQQNVSQIIGEILQSNEIKANALCPANIEITDIEQLNVANLKLESTMMTNISTTIAQNAISNIDKFLSNMQVNQSTEHSGDIQQLGTAAGGVITSAGEAVSNVTDSVLGGLSGPLKYLMIGIVIIAVIAGIAVLVNPDAFKSTVKGGDDDDYYYNKHFSQYLN